MGDLRALPMLAWVLDWEPMPDDAAYCVYGLGPKAASLIPQLRQRLRDLPSDDRRDHRRDSVVGALSTIGPAAVEALPDLLDGPVTWAAVRAFGIIGADADACGPVLRRAATGDDSRLAVLAARSLWQVAGDPAAALEVADRRLADESEFAWQEAAALLADIRQATETQLTQLARLARQEDRTGWTPLSAATALWRITGDPGPLLPVLEQVWTANVHTRLKVVSLWAELGQAASKAHPLLMAELSGVRRHNKDSYSGSSVSDDEALLAECRIALAAIGADK